MSYQSSVSADSIEFKDVFEKNRNRLFDEMKGKGMEDQQAEIISIKAAVIETDMYFSEMEKEEKKLRKAG